MATEPLLIPISMKAMLVGEPQDQFADISYNYSSLNSYPLGDMIEPKLTGKNSNMDRGIHIHWILPDAMKHGSVGNQKEDHVSYPAVPNRWYITRLWTKLYDSNDEVYSLSWIVESDALQKESNESIGNFNSPQVPFINDFSQQYRYLGRSYLINEPSIKDANDQNIRDAYGQSIRDDSKQNVPCTEFLELPLTAILPGLPAFAAYYPDCRNVFGFHDNMCDKNGEELGKVSVTYVVCGWYSDNTHDILNGITNADECKNKFKWSVPENFNFPAQSICHSMISGIKWDSKNSEYESNIPNNDISFAVGNTTAEALATLTESKTEYKDGATENVMERMLNFFYSSGEILLKDKNSLIKSENKIHEHRFGKKHSFTQLVLKKSDGKQNSTVEEPPNEKLRQINNYYADIFKRKAEFKNLQEQVYDCWYKYLYVAERTNINEINQNEEYLRNYIDQIEKLGNDINVKISQINSLEEEKLKLLKDLKNLVDYTIVEQSGQHFWIPNEPVLLLSGVKSDSKHSGEDTLFCRNKSQTISSLTIDKLDGVFNTPQKINFYDILSDDINFTGDIPDVVNNIVNESLIISTDFALNIARKMLDLNNCRTEKNQETLVAIIKKLQCAQAISELIHSFGRSKLSEASGFNGIYPEQTAVCQWSKPWSPLFVRWSVNYYPDPAVLDDEPSLRNWEMEETSQDYYLNGEISTDNLVTIQGQSILAPNGAMATASCCIRHLGDADLANEALNMDVLSQVLSGMNGKFIMEKTDMILPVDKVNYSKIKVGDTTFPVDKISSLLKGYIPSSPFFDEFFSPIRAGFMNIEEVDIIDSFGQLKTINNIDVVVAESMRNNMPLKQKNIFLAPRLIQPSRLNFCWLSQESNLPQYENSAESPICGWLLPNHMDCSIMVYDSDGNLLGSLQRVELDKPVVWKSTPENGGGTEMLPKDMNPTLYKIISAILDVSDNENIDILTPILEVINESLWSINPNAANQYNSLGSYVGRPLIVVNSCINLEQKYIQKSFKHLEINSNTDNCTVNSKIDVTKAKFDIQVGARVNHGDGVIGFFKDFDYSIMHINADEPQSKHEYFNADNTVTLTLGDELPTNLTIIMDFAASIDFISGILPTKTVKPNEHAISEALNKLYFTIFSAPVLGDINEFAIPCPKLDGREWRWLHFSDSNFKDEQISSASQQAYFPNNGLCAEEGWLKLKLNEVKSNNK